MRDAMLAWKEDVHLPLVVDIYWDGDDQRQLLEQWTVLYAPLGVEGDGVASPGGYALANTRDVIQQLKEVCKKISVLLRALHSFIRLLPAHRIVRQSYPSRLGYAIHSRPSVNAASGAQDSPFERNAISNGYSFDPIMTPFGYLKVSTVYCQNCDQLSEQRVHEVPAQIFKDNFIIQDYVPGSPDLKPMQQRQIDDNYVLNAQQPRGATETRTDSFVPVSDAEHFTSERRRRSSPQSIPGSGVNEPAQQYPQPARRTQSISQPMAIPQTKKPVPAYDEHNHNGLPATGNTRAVQHAHSYGDPERLRDVDVNPHVTPAPYGYGNVAIDQQFNPPSNGTHLQSREWMGSAEGSSGGGTATSISPLSGHEDAAGLYHPMSTPPRHPKTVSMFRNRGMSASGTKRASGGPGSVGSDYHHTRASLENFTLDDIHSPTTAAAVPVAVPDISSNSTTSGSSKLNSAPAASPYMTPPFTPSQPRTDGVQSGRDDSSSANSLAIKKATSAGLPVFDSSPPFLSNPVELLSTSPGYSYSKNYLRTGPSTLPMFVTTNQFRVRREETFATPTTAGGQVMNTNKQRHFSADFGETGGFWGVSPDTPDSFGLALVGSAGSGYRQRLLSGSGSASVNTEDDLLDADDADMTLPFALGNDSNISSGTTITVASSASGRPSSAGSSHAADIPSGNAWDTASVGNFLHQLNHAPPLQSFAQTEVVNELAVVTEAAVDNVVPAADAVEVLTVVSAFDDELESFRNLRDEMAQHL